MSKTKIECPYCYQDCEIEGKDVFNVWCHCGYQGPVQPTKEKAIAENRELVAKVRFADGFAAQEDFVALEFHTFDCPDCKSSNTKFIAVLECDDTDKRMLSCCIDCGTMWKDYWSVEEPPERVKGPELPEVTP